ncbi:hypothetical protein C8A00DRAFT_42097 [Chaetomidium leptoderma]|uniref:Succinate dehydrogenase assembly factor 4, mitochondrial n=1 Tax=Chaetomidium leptoderma TaxID=669021 RepID=A0AAN7A029_9PEZI|nr:hypothetical protein C8A00DRAFT_42097 [Chaetomidium leptoderma]
MSRLLRPSLLLRSLSRTTTIPTTTTTTRRHASSSLQNSPAPPRLPASEQAEFERLQRAAEAALSSHASIPAATASDSSAQGQTQTQTQTQQTAGAGATAAGPEAGTFSGGMRKGAPPEFEGDKHPRTGEVGGPKNEPLRWGSGGDWSFNGRVTDF